MTQEAVNEGIFQGVKVGSDGICVSYLQYAVDTIIFGERNKSNAGNLMGILKCFEEVSGLKVNVNKSRLYGVGAENERVSEMARWMGVV